MFDRHVRLSLLASACGLAALLCGCSSAGSASPTASHAASTASSATSTSTAADASTSASLGPSASAAQAALAAYRAMYTDWASAAATSNYQDPALAHHASGSALSKITRALYIDKTEGTVGKGQPVINPAVSHLVSADNPTQVVINDCFDDSNWLQYTTDGHLYNNVPGGRHKTQALVVETGSSWKVDQLAVQAVGTC
jgi:hypothetical protein